jgi:hypothetical protein
MSNAAQDLELLGEARWRYGKPPRIDWLVRHTMVI